MDAIWQWGISLIIIIQQVHGTVLDNIMRAITFAGEEQFYLLLIPLILWCFDYYFGAVLTFFFLMSAFVNFSLKDLLQHPRPFDLDPGVKLSQATGYGLPSGHAQLSLIVWGSLADRVKKKWFWIVAAVIVLLISFSRIYLGVHFPTDVFAGLIIGGILLAIYFAFRLPVERWLTGLNLAFQLLLVIIISIILLFPSAGVDSLTISGMFLGVGVGLIFKRRSLPYSSGGPWWQRAARYIVGIAILFALYLGLKAVFPPDGSIPGSIFRVVRYALIGGWIIIGAPWFFRVTRLAKGPG